MNRRQFLEKSSLAARGRRIAPSPEASFISQAARRAGTGD
jgi:hypothetical protein